MSRASQTIRALGLALACGLLLGGCTTHPAPLISFHELRLVRSFKPIPIYWAGLRLQGVPVTAADDGTDYGATNGMTVYYGDCEHTASPLGQGCTLPLEITTVVYVPHSNASLRPYRMLTIRGVPAISWEGGRWLEVYTSYLSIDITADSATRALAAANALSVLNAPPPLVAGANLPPPTFVPGLPVDPQATVIANALRSLPGTDTTLSLIHPGKPLP